MSTEPESPEPKATTTVECAYATANSLHEEGGSTQREVHAVTRVALTHWRKPALQGRPSTAKNN